MLKQHRQHIFFLIVLISAVIAITAKSETIEQKVDGKFIKDWLVIGPFFPDDLDRDFFVNARTESSVTPNNGDTVITSQGDTLEWKKVHSSQPIIDLFKVIGKYQHATAYAFCTINSTVDITKQILLGSDDGVAVWINGKQVHHNPAARSLFLDQDKFAVDLKKGDNRCLVKITQGIGNWGFSIRIKTSGQTDLSEPNYFLSSDYLQNDFYLPNNFWKYHFGDSSDYAKADFDDSNWKYASPWLAAADLPSLNWQGTGWFRFHFVIDTSLVNIPIGLSLSQAGSSEVFLDGSLLGKFSEQGNSEKDEIKIFTFKKGVNHTLAVKYSIESTQKFQKIGFNSGFLIRLGSVDQMVNESTKFERPFIIYQIIFTTLSIAIGLMHLIFFAFFPQLRQNLYFALYLFSYAIAIYFDYQQLLTTNTADILFYLKIHRAIWPIFLVLKLRFIYSLFYKNISKQIWQFGIISFFALGLSILALIDPIKSFEFIDLLFMAIVAEIIRVISIAIVNKKEGGWIIGSAFLVFLIFVIFDYIMDAGITVPFQEMRNPYAFGIVAFFIAMSVYLSRDFSRTNRKLAEQEIERKLLEAENERQSRELEEARQLQLSMLPEKLPELAWLEIGVFMNTASEVGGDYYDFKHHDDGTLTTVIGDATGHGMQAGTMVSAMKSLFHAMADEPDPVVFLNKSTKVIKTMGLRKMYMALTIAKFKDYEVKIASAGMPFPMIYRSLTGQIEVVKLKGMPLGGFSSFPYHCTEIKLKKDDIVLFRSDGYEEMFNPQNEMLGEEKLTEFIKEAPKNTVEEVIEFLKNKGKSWANGREQEDDITFVVFKIK